MISETIATDAQMSGFWIWMPQMHRWGAFGYEWHRCTEL